MENDAYKKLSQKLIRDGGFSNIIYPRLYEYFKKNIKGLDDFISKNFIDKYHNERHNHLYMDDEFKYVICQLLTEKNRKPSERDIVTMQGDFYCLPSRKIDIEEAMYNEEEIITIDSSIHSETNDDYFWRIVKQQLNKNGVYVEEYTPGMKVMTLIYSPEEYEKALDKTNDGQTSEYRINSQYLAFVSYPFTASQLKLKNYKMVIAACNPIKEKYVCIIDYYENGELIDTTRVAGKTLYEAYYDYMVEKGYFIDDEKQKIK